MKTQNIQEQIKNLEAKITSLKNKLNDESNKSEWIEIPGTEYEVTKEVLHKGKTFNEIMQLKKPEEELLTLKLIGIICEYPELLKLLKMDSSSIKDDFFFKQPFPQNEKNGYVAGFCANSDYAVLDCGFNPDGSSASLGVRWVRKKFLRGKKKCPK